MNVHDETNCGAYTTQLVLPADQVCHGDISESALAMDTTIHIHSRGRAPFWKNPVPA